MERNIRLLDLLQQGSSRVGGDGDHDGDDHGDADHGHGDGECVGFALYFIGTLLIFNKLKFQI